MIYVIKLQMYKKETYKKKYNKNSNNTVNDDTIHLCQPYFHIIDPYIKTQKHHKNCTDNTTTQERKQKNLQGVKGVEAVERWLSRRGTRKLKPAKCDFSLSNFNCRRAEAYKINNTN